MKQSRLFTPKPHVWGREWSAAYHALEILE